MDNMEKKIEVIGVELKKMSPSQKKMFCALCDADISKREDQWHKNGVIQCMKCFLYGPHDNGDPEFSEAEMNFKFSTILWITALAEYIAHVLEAMKESKTVSKEPYTSNVDEVHTKKGDE